MTLEALSPLQQRLSALNSEPLSVHGSPRASSIGEQARLLCSSLLHWKARCASLPKDTVAGILDTINLSFSDNTITPWEHFSVSLVFPRLSHRRGESASQLAQTLHLDKPELLAASYVFSKLGLVQSALQCLNIAITQNDFTDDQLLEATSTLIASLNTSFIQNHGVYSSSRFGETCILHEHLTRLLRSLGQGTRQSIPLEDINLSKQEQAAWFDLQDTIRCLHHVACSGGTVISKCLAAMSKVCLLSEANPLNRYGIDFNPSNPFLLYEQTQGKVPLDVVRRGFAQEIEQLLTLAKNNKKQLILRDHSHSDFFSGIRRSRDEVAGLYGCLANDYSLISAITVRHPLDSYLTLASLGWDVQFQPNTFEEYCSRYIDFLDYYSEIPTCKYEDFCADPDSFMQELCGILFIEYDPEYRQRFGSVQLSGDSGRRSNDEIKPRGRRPVSESLKKESEESSAYRELCSRLGYEAD